MAELKIGAYGESQMAEIILLDNMISIRMAWGVAQISAISAISAGPLMIKMIRIIGTAV